MVGLRTVDRVRLEAYLALLAMPDGADLVGRGHRVTCSAYPAKREAFFRRITAVYFADRRQWHGEIQGSTGPARVVRFGRRA